MGWSIGFDERWNRDIGYGVPAVCDFPGCGEKISRGLAHVCGSEPYGGDRGCGLYFCEKHREYHPRLKVSLCHRCGRLRGPYKPTADSLEWVKFKLKDSSWEAWRKENPRKVTDMGLVVLYHGWYTSDEFKNILNRNSPTFSRPQSKG